MIDLEPAPGVYLFVGGLADGLRLPVPDLERPFTYVKPPTTDPVRLVDGPIDARPIESQDYRPHSIHTADRQIHWVMVPVTWAPSDLIHHLLSNYPRVAR